MGLFSGLFGGGGSAKRAAQAEADKAAEARSLVKSESEKYGAYYDPYREAGQAAIGGQQAALSDVSGRISALDPRREALRGQQAALQPQVSEMYTLAQQQDPILSQITSGDYDAYTQSPGYEFRRQEGLKALEQSAAAKGGLFSGQTGKELERYGQGVATSEYDRYLDRLYNQLGAVDTQLGGRQAALGAGQQQIAGGVSLLDQDFKQIAAQMGVSDAYQNLINQGLSATDAAAKLGMDAANVRGALTKGIGETYASGMQAKAAQMGAAGDQWANLGATALGMDPIYNTAGAGQQQFGGTQAFGQQGGGGALQPQITRGSRPALGGGYNMPTQAQPWANPNNMQMGQTDPNLPWLKGAPQQQAALRTASSFNRGFA